MSTSSILQQVAAGTLTPEEGQKLIDNMTQKSKSTASMKVSPKGCIAFNGIRKMPICLYLQELEAILELILHQIPNQKLVSDLFLTFLRENGSKLSIKSDRPCELLKLVDA